MFTKDSGINSDHTSFNQALTQDALYAPPFGVQGLPSLPVQKLPDIMASGNKSEQERTPRDRCS